MPTTPNGLKRGNEARFTSFSGIDTSKLLIELVLGGSWNRTMTLDDFVAALSPLIESASYKIERFTALGAIAEDTDLVISTGTHTLSMPTQDDLPLTIKSVSGTITLAPGGNTFEGASTVGALASRTLILDGTVWRDI